MNILSELKKKYTSAELVALTASLACTIVSAVLINSNSWLTIASLISGLVVMATITTSKSRFEHQLEVELGMKFDGFGGLNINGLVVSEFGYLLRYITEGQLDNFNDFEKIHNSQEEILLAIKNECSKEVTKEEEAFGVAREIAEANLKNLAEIVITISNYHTKTAVNN